MTYALHFTSSPARERMESAGRAQAKIDAERKAERLKAALTEARQALTEQAASAAVAKSIRLAAIKANYPLWRRIMIDVVTKHGMTMEYFKASKEFRKRRQIQCRREMAYRLRRETSLSLPEIGRRMGGFDHTTILHHVRQYEALAKESAA